MTGTLKKGAISYFWGLRTLLWRGVFGIIGRNMDGQGVHSRLSRGSALVRRFVLISLFHLPAVQASLESCSGMAWFGIEGVACPRILLAVVGYLFLFPRLYVTYLHHGDCIGFCLAL